MNFLSVAAKAIARRIRRWLQPSLVRRLLLAQVMVVGLLWGATLAFFLYDSNRLPELVRYDKLFDSIIACARKGQTSIGGLTEAGEAALARRAISDRKQA